MRSLRIQGQSKRIRSLINKMLPAISKNKLAHFIDVFLWDGLFYRCRNGANYECWCPLWLKAKIHVNQFNSIGGFKGKTQALSVDHLEIMTPEDIEALKHETMPVALPSCSYFLSIPYTPARKWLQLDFH
jgi:imidazolonepropionase